MMFINLMD